jgi:formylglycine-generating enzyme required for sulfatase activity
MKTYLVVFVFILSCAGANSQSHRGFFDVFPNKKVAAFGFAWIEKERLAISQAEISVDEYLYFLEEVSKDSGDAYIKTLIPSEACVLAPYVEKDKIGEEPEGRKISWIDEDRFMKENNNPPAVLAKGFDKQAFNPYNRPITGISYEQAVQYAWWCTSYFNHLYYFTKKYNKRVLIFRLPTPTEFETIARKGYDCSTESQKKSRAACKNDLGCALCNYAGKDSCAANNNATAMLGNGPYPIHSYFPDCNGVYNLQGNVAEMTSKKGIAKGGSYLHKASECQPESVQEYSKAEKWIGIRLIAEVKEVDGDKISFDEDGFLVIKK